MPVEVLVGASVWTGDGAVADAVAWEGDTLIAVGAREAVLAAAGEGAVVRDVGGRTVLPGFIDAHHHASMVALFGGAVSLEPPVVTDIASLQAALATAAARLPVDWIMAIGWDETLLAEKRPPTRDELDAAVSDRPVVALHYGCHRAVANSLALQAAGIDANTPDPPGGQIERGRGGRPTGLLIERAISGVESRARASLLARDAEGFLARLASHHDALLAVGITRLVDTTVPGDVAVLYREAERRGMLKVATVMCPVSTGGYLEVPTEVLDGEPTAIADRSLSVGPVKLVFDGAPSCAMCLGWWQSAGMAARTMAMSLASRSLAPVKTALSVAPRLGKKLRTGILLYRHEDAVKVFRSAHARGFAVATHAVGNEAIDVVLGGYEAVGEAIHKAGRARIEHASFLDRGLVGRIAATGTVVVTQPSFLTLPTFAHAASIPGLPNMPLRWLLDAKVTVAGSSDHPVTGFDPLDGVRAAVERKTRNGEVREAEQCITLDEALGLYTHAAALASGMAHRAGTLTPGKRADLVVLDRALTPNSLAEAKVSATVIGGQLAHGRW